MSDPIRVDSVADLAYERIRGHVLGGDVPPGARLGQVELAERFGISRTPVREALRRLAGEGLVDFHSNRGFRVADLGLDAVLRRLEVRAILEPGIAALAAALAFAYAPWRLEHDGHLHVLSSGGIPLALALLVRGYRRDSGRTVLAGWLVAAWQITLGFGIGLVIYAIRRWGAYADGVAFAVLLMNMARPAIDYVTRPRIVGHARNEAR